MNLPQLYNLTSAQKNIWMIEALHNNTNINSITR